jgi:hypothetical protein
VYRFYEVDAAIMLFFLKKIQRSTTCGKNICLPVGWEVEKNFLKHADTIKF